MTSKEPSHLYDDIIDLPHPTSLRHPRMSLYNRAAQFSPFAALTGYEEAIQETARLTDERMELDETAKAQIDQKLQYIKEKLPEEIAVDITCFVPDKKKAGGCYKTLTGSVKRINEYEHTVILKEGEVIPIVQIYRIEFCDGQATEFFAPPDRWL